MVRRTDRFWTGLSADLVIEQVLMRSIKTTGGLTRGRGMTETQRLVWVLSTPACAEVNRAMQEFTSVEYNTSEQHIDVTPARLERDNDDTNKLTNFLLLHNPFHPDPSLRNIATGVTSTGGVNADHAKEVGNRILEAMRGKQVLEHSFKKKDQVVTLSAKSGVKIKDDVVHIDPQLLFQRLTTVGSKTKHLSGIFQYELCIATRLLCLKLVMY